MEIPTLMVVLNDKMSDAQKQLFDYQMKKINTNYILVNFNFANFKPNENTYLTLDKRCSTLNKILLFENFSYVNTKINVLKKLNNINKNTYLTKNVYLISNFEKIITDDILKIGFNKQYITSEDILNNNIFSEQYEPSKHVLINKDSFTDKNWVQNQSLYEKSYNNLVMNVDTDYQKFVEKMDCYLSIVYLNDDNINAFCSNHLTTNMYNIRFILIVDILDTTKHTKNLQKIVDSTKCEYYIIGHINSFQLRNKLQDEKYKGMNSMDIINDSYVNIDNKSEYLLKVMMLVQNKLLRNHERILIINDFSIKIDEMLSDINSYNKLYDNFIKKNYLLIPTMYFFTVKFTNICDMYNDIIINVPHAIEKTYICNQIINKIVYQKELTSDDKIDIFMQLKMYDSAMAIIDKLIEENYDVYKGFDYIRKKIALDVLCKKTIDSTNLLRVIYSINDVPILRDICILCAQHPNKQVTERSFVRLLSLLIEKNDPMDEKLIKFCLSKLRTFSDKETANLLIRYVKTLDSTLLTLNDKNTETNNETNDETKKANETKIEEVKALKNDLMKVISIYLKYNMNDTDLVSKYEELFDNKVIKLEEDSETEITEYIYDKSVNFNPYYSSIDAMMENRDTIDKNLEILNKSYNNKYTLDSILNILPNNFCLSYQGLPSVEIFKKRASLMRKICPDLNFKIDTSFVNEKINILFHAEQLTREHSVYKDRHQVIAQLSNDERFNVYFSTFAKLTEPVKYSFGKAKHIILPQNLGQIRDKLVSLKLDVLCYCELGMHPISYFMAFMKLAKIQLNSWGHSDSCGIDTVDYFVSSKLYELPIEESQTHYNEKLILLNSMSTYYINPMSRHIGKKFKSRNQLGFTNDIDIYFCAQSGFKLTPFFDEYIIRILKSNKNAKVILLNSTDIDKIISRFNDHGVGNQFTIIPASDHFTYLNYINISDVILDPYPFGGCNSSLESFSLNKPVITQPSKMINGRFTHGFYQKMDILDLVANSMDEYVDLAIKLIKDKAFYAEMSEKIYINKNKLFNEELTITEWKDLMVDLYNKL
jgi:predicted O-linked N-acetylglucosamine transferase (SPINDLY family)